MLAMMSQNREMPGTAAHNRLLADKNEQELLILVGLVLIPVGFRSTGIK
jgi:hypothetical protein